MNPKVKAKTPELTPQKAFGAVSPEGVLYYHTIHFDRNISEVLFEEIIRRPFRPWAEDRGYRIVEVTVIFPKGGPR